MPQHANYFMRASARTSRAPPPPRMRARTFHANFDSAFLSMIATSYDVTQTSHLRPPRRHPGLTPSERARLRARAGTHRRWSSRIPGHSTFSTMLARSSFDPWNRTQRSDGHHFANSRIQLLASTRGGARVTCCSMRARGIARALSAAHTPYR